MAVDTVALAAVPLAAAPLVVVTLLYWIDLAGGVLRRALQTALARPRKEYSPTGPPVTRPNGEPGPLRFLIPKLGGVRPARVLPRVTPHNLRAGLPGLLWGCLVTVGVGATATVIQTPLAAWPTVGVLAVGVAVVAARHGWALRQFCRSERLPDRKTARAAQLVGSVVPGFVVLLADDGYTVADPAVSTTLTATAVVVVVGRVAYRRLRDRGPSADADVDAEPVTLSAPDRRPIARFRADGRGVRIAGAIDGLLPRVDADVFNVWVRLAGAFLPAIGVFWGVVVLDLALPIAVVLGGVLPVVAVGGALVLLGVAHFELAFGAMEYRLYEDEIVAYDARLDAVQWRAPLASIRDVTVADGWWLSPPGTDAGTVRLDRSDLATTQKPYGFVRGSLVCVADPGGAADRLRRELRRHGAGAVSAETAGSASER